MADPEYRPTFLPLIRYIWRKRPITDPLAETELMVRYVRRYGTYQPPNRHIPMTPETLENRNHLSQKQIDEFREELGLTWKDLADACGIKPASMKYHRSRPEMAPKHQKPIIALFLDQLQTNKLADEIEKIPATKTDSDSGLGQFHKELKAMEAVASALLPLYYHELPVSDVDDLTTVSADG
jgi:hypothetical protein